MDDVSLEAYEEDLQNNLYKLWNRMSSGSYFPQAGAVLEVWLGNRPGHPIVLWNEGRYEIDN